jgi:hypothetical protein
VPYLKLVSERKPALKYERVGTVRRPEIDVYVDICGVLARRRDSVDEVDQFGQ